ncbi:MAG: long-chain fatty acid--CoA ligase [Acidobacteria bacterium]|nr:long-chain fatty acid--CoA ligase [Acidobacteriota bacterium]MBV9623602.1 long-chain fatty acid--CoA ligase [Acidobacteriota bacterium]
MRRRARSFTFSKVSLETLNDIFFAIAGREQPELFLRRHESGWKPLSSQQFVRLVSSLSNALAALGISRGDRVAILSENRHEWVVADVACLLRGAVVVPIYTTLTAEQTAYLLRDSLARAVFVSSRTHLEKVLSIWTSTALEKIIVMDQVALEPAIPISKLFESAAEPQLDGIKPVERNELATIIYTSGTTGTPKGVMLTHGNMAANIKGFLESFDFGLGMASVSFLPLSHVTARSVDLGLLYSGVTLAHLPQIENLPRALGEIRPHILLSVPRVYEKIYAQVELEAGRFPKRQIYQWALRVGRAHRDETLAGETPRTLPWNLADRLVYSKIRQRIGGRVRIFISGGAPLGRALAEWYADIGIRIHEGYGLTETSPVVAVNNPHNHRIGSVGKPLTNVEVRIAEDQEILVRGPSVFQGYWNKLDETQAAFIDGWFKTGDIGRIDEAGFLYVTDRKKDLLKTSGGKFIAPQPIENNLKHFPLVAEAVVVGERRRFPAVLIFPNFAALEMGAREKNLPFSSREELLRLGEVRRQYADIVSKVNDDLAQFEKLKAFRLISDELSAANGTLTASLKLRRRAIEELFKPQIEEMYSEGRP